MVGACYLAGPRGDDEPAPQSVGGDALVADDFLVDRSERAWDAGVEPGPDGPADHAWQHPVKQGSRAVPVAGPQKQQAARLERARQPVENEFDVVNPFKKQGAVNHVVGALRDGDGAQVAGDHVVVGGLCVAEHAVGPRRGGADRGNRYLDPALGEVAEAEWAERGKAARL